LKRRNDTSHTYDEDTAAEVVVCVKNSYFQAFMALYEKMKGFASKDQQDLFSQM
jgi:hypothetical protein